ncbi:MAG: hypothetical protein HY565_01950 [Candidatus Kerfeldbacteria bacterium]|nr:hypothetical protein [Candidatus Kerfeldbacteria bacterium]
MKNVFNKKNILTAIALLAIGILGRLALEAYPNVETLTAVSIIAGALLGPYLGLAVALFSVVGSDMVIGNTNILLYTWTAWAVIGVGSAWLKRKQRGQLQVWLDSLKFTGFGVVTTLFFYAWTNFGVWHLSGMYLHTWDGLMLSYYNGLPFLRNQLLGNLLIVPVLSVATLSVLKYVPVFLQQRVQQRQSVKI